MAGHVPSCSPCDRNFLSDKSLQQHLQRPRWYDCAPCAIAYTSYSQLQIHWKTYSGHQSTYCDRCDINFPNSALRDDHVRKVPSRHFLCCDMDYPSVEQLQTHHSTSTEHYQTYCQKCKRNFQNSNNLREHLKVHMPKDLDCWGCGGNKRFATISAMLIHLESGICTAGWRIHHINTLAVLAPHSKAFIIGGKVPWLRAGAPPRFVQDAYYDAKRGPGVWVCPTCDAVFAKRPLLYHHLQDQFCCQGYPEVLKCPICPDRFTTLSGMFQHIETPRCPASKDTKSISHLLAKLQNSLAKPASQAKLVEIQYKLAPDPDRPNKLIVKVIDTSGDEDIKEPAVVQIGLVTVSIAS